MSFKVAHTGQNKAVERSYEDSFTMQGSGVLPAPSHAPITNKNIDCSILFLLAQSHLWTKALHMEENFFHFYNAFPGH